MNDGVSNRYSNNVVSHTTRLFFHFCFCKQIYITENTKYINSPAKTSTQKSISRCKPLRFQNSSNLSFQLSVRDGTGEGRLDKFINSLLFLRTGGHNIGNTFTGSLSSSEDVEAGGGACAGCGGGEAWAEATRRASEARESFMVLYLDLRGVRVTTIVVLVEEARSCSDIMMMCSLHSD